MAETRRRVASRLFSPEAKARFDAAWPQLEPMLLGYFQRRGLGGHSHDLVQQVALRLTMNLDRIDSQQRMQAYAWTAARWVAIEHWRERPVAEVVGDALLAALPSGEPEPADAVEARQLAQRALDALSRRERDVVERLMAGESNAQIAAALDISEGTVRSLLRFARARIIEFLEG